MAWLWLVWGMKHAFPFRICGVELRFLVARFPEVTRCSSSRNLCFPLAQSAIGPNQRV